MELHDLQAFLTQSPTAKLLRAQSGALILQFLHRAFKQSQRITIPHDELVADLNQFREELQQEHPEALHDSATHYLNTWCHDDNRFLQRFFQGGSDEPVYQLTAHTESALRFVRESLEREAQCVGTESRMLTIVETFRDLAVFAGDDPTRQIETLEGEVLKLQAQIDHIKETGCADKYDDAQVRERFLFAMELLHGVLSDFRQVEDKFKAITREVQDLQISGDFSKGGLLEFVLDAENVLKESDQGKSFYGFVNLILSPQRQDSLRQLVDEVRRLEQLQPCQEAVETLKHLMPLLTAEAEQVMQTSQRLSASIRRFLDGKLADDRRQVGVIIEEILTLARKNRDKPPVEEDVEIAIDGGLKVFSPWSRPFWSPSAEVETVGLAEAEASDDEVDEAFELLAQMRRLDWQLMRDRIKTLTKRENSITLPRLLQQHPPQSGAVEVLAYVQIAQDDDHVILEDESDDILLPESGDGLGQRTLRVPRVVFQATLSA